MRPELLRTSDARYPRRLAERLAEDAPKRLAAVGNIDLIRLPKTALFCSAQAPGRVILSAHDEAVRWREEGRCVISGFHSPLEKQCLQILLRGRQPLIICLARGIQGMRLPVGWKKPLAANRLLILSQFGSTQRRVTRTLAVARNKLVAALADEVVFAHVTPGGQLAELRQLIDGWGVPHSVLAA